MSGIEEKIRNFEQKQDSQGLQEFLENVPYNDLAILVQQKLSSPNFIYIWNHILQSFTDEEDSQKKRFELVMKVIKDVESNDISNSLSSAIMTRTCMELPRFETAHLLAIVDFCVECIQQQKVLAMNWKEVLPVAVNILSMREQIEHNNEQLSGTEYKQNFIKSISMLQWFPPNVTTLAEMFVDFNLTKDEHLQIVRKLSTYMEKLTPQEIPSFIYQVLRVCKHGNGRIIFTKLQQFFGLRLKYDNNETDSEQTDLDTIEDTSNQELIEAEGTVLYHIHSAAFTGEESIKDYLVFLKKLLRAPDIVLQIYQLTVLLTISTIPHYEEGIFEIIRSCISKYYHEEQKKTNSAWFREMILNKNTVEPIFSKLIFASVNMSDRELVLNGLVNFAFVLLGVGSQLGRDPIAEQQWQLGNLILFKIIKRKRHSAPYIIEQLSSKILTNQNVYQYVECLYMLTTKLTLLMLENKNLIIPLIEGVALMPASAAKPLLDAIIPLTKVSPSIRDQYIILLRKALYSKLLETRQVAVIGFLKLITNLKISNSVILSGSSFTGSFSSGHSIYTQLSMRQASQSTPSTFSNEALCLESLSILRRCFMQQLEVKVQLYEGLLQAVSINPEIGVSMLDMLFLHFRDFYITDEDVLPPLKFTKITVTKDVTVTQLESLGKLIYTIGLITAMTKNDCDNGIRVRFTRILESICLRMAKCELIHFELDDGTDLQDYTPEAQHKLIMLKDAMSVYEALIGFKFYIWELDCDNNAKEINALFQCYARLSSFLKNSTKSKKNEGKKKILNKTVQVTLDNNSTISKNSLKPKVIKPVESTIDFHVLSKILSLLHESMVTWTTMSQANIIKSKREFHQHIMQTTLNLLTSIKNRKYLDLEAAKTVYAHLCSITKVIYERIIKRMNEFIDFDCSTAVLAAESFLLIMNIIVNNFRSNFESFLIRIGRQNREGDLVVHLNEFIEVYQKLFEIDEEEMTDDPEIKKLSVCVTNTLRFFINQLPVSNTVETVKIIEWSKNYAINKKIANKQVSVSFINLLFDYHIKAKSELTFFVDIAIRLGEVTGVINEEESNVEPFKIINESTINTFFLTMCNSIKSILEDIDYIISRLNSELCLMPYESNLESYREKLKDKECGVCCQLCFIISLLTHLSNCTVPLGNMLEGVIKSLTQLYCTLGSLAKYFTQRSSKNSPVFQRARFDRVVKLAGKQLSPVVYKFILYLEECQKREVTSPKKKKVDSSVLKNKVLKETKLIPKLVYEIEQFSKFVMKLSKKSDVDLSKLVGQGTVRDFRILHLKEVLEENPTQRIDITSAGSADYESVGEEEEDETTPPPTKKNKSQKT